MDDYIDYKQNFEYSLKLKKERLEHIKKLITVIRELKMNVERVKDKDDLEKEYKDIMERIGDKFKIYEREYMNIKAKKKILDIKEEKETEVLNICFEKLYINDTYRKFSKWKYKIIDFYNIREIEMEK